MGPVALPPTEMTYYDTELDIRDAFLALHRYMYKFQVNHHSPLVKHSPL